MDDGWSITDLLEYNLHRNGYQVIVARDGRQALRLAEAEHPDLVILDLMLPGLDGLDVCRVLRRTTSTASAEIGADAVCRIGSLEVDTLSRKARIAGDPLPLTRLEFELLEALVRHVGQVLNRDQLLDQVWGYDYYGDARAVDSAITRLRAKLHAAGGDDALLSTVRGVGYRMERANA
ncbi:MAG: response regulator transcription factor [Anaerolineae bacterium]